MTVARDFIDGTPLVEASAMARRALRTSTGVSKVGWMVVAFAVGVALVIAARLLHGQDWESAQQVADHPPLDEEEYRRLLEERTRRYLKMSLDDFLKHLDAGTLPDTAVVAHLKGLVGAAAAEPSG